MLRLALTEVFIKKRVNFRENSKNDIFTVGSEKCSLF